jgi:folate-binding protein YgfZ
LISEIKNAKELLDYILSHKSVFDLSMVGEKAFDYYRVIHRVPKFPNEINDKFNPHEAGLMNEVNSSKGCYIGQEVIARLETYEKVQKSLKKVKIEGMQTSTLPVEIYYQDDQLLGILTTSVKVLENNHLEGLAFIRSSFIDKPLHHNVKSSAGDAKVNLRIVE